MRRPAVARHVVAWRALVGNDADDERASRSERAHGHAGSIRDLVRLAAPLNLRARSVAEFGSGVVSVTTHLAANGNGPRCTSVLAVLVFPCGYSLVAPTGVHVTCTGGVHVGGRSTCTKNGACTCTDSVQVETR